MATDVMSRLQSPYTGLVNIDTRLGEETLSPAFVKHLEHYYDRAPVADKARCLELITSIKLGEEVKRSQVRRPKTAMPALGGPEGMEDILSPYKTTYKREYIKRRDPEVRALRPMTSQAYTNAYSLSGPVGNTTYHMEYNAKSELQQEPVRSGSASGNRKNNPHPSNAFMVWRFPSNKNPVPDVTPWAEEVTNEKLNQVHKRLCSSTYQTDYLGIPQGFQVRSAYNLPGDWRENIPYTLDSVQRYSYQGAAPQNELRVPTTRYGSNKKKQLAANGGIPTANQYLNSIKSRTTYDRHYNENAGPVVRQIRDVGKRLGAETLRKYYERSSGEDRELVGRLIDAYQEPTSHRPPKPSSRACSRPVVPASTSVTNFCTAPMPTPPPGAPGPRVLSS
ncbi:testis-expressed protein 26-like isoform X1 [Haliotis rubra]|uniref:testis-expressed protein 26-like isoform X1 n=2 Tax=Haliotis rubra TaxID=36100 RepID=UPI001EE51D62|nr:testis-expressed protein 26-like isoform X1 [Haliotis rubra]